MILFHGLVTWVRLSDQKPPVFDRSYLILQGNIPALLINRKQSALAYP